MISLGPILGIERDYRYSLILLLPKKLETASGDLLKLVVSARGKRTSNPPATYASTFGHTLYRFEFEVDPSVETEAVDYTIELSGAPLENASGETSWSFVVPGKEVVPKVGFASCNGNDKLLAPEMDAAEFVMWDKLIAAHNQEELSYAFHCLLLCGDQVYADPIWDRVPYFKKYGLNGRNSGKKMSAHRIDPAEKEAFIAQLEAFYEDLYIGCWTRPSIAKVLASVPSVMMWDDHDIFDGWGSYPTELQNCEVFQVIYDVAKRYFELLQIRTRLNSALISNDHYSQRVPFRNFEMLILDNRSLRTRDQIMSDLQYQELESVRDGSVFDQAKGELAKQRTFIFGIPVPVAHLNYKKRAEGLLGRLGWLFKGDFRKSLDDDALDHWDHHLHADEQKRLIDLLFSFGDRHDPKYIHIVSGDVHSAGAGRIERRQGAERHVNQLIASPIVYHPVGRFQQKIVHWVSEDVTDIPGYRVRVDRFGLGENAPANIYERNFGFLYKATGKGIMFYLTLEHDQEKYAWDQPRLFNPDS
ncbi:alkaline phosphatase D family protein [Litoreibacter roseus]|uniref:Metallophosphatase n=1 Tax=Litoreibacter roseus TaxID=2601869 RepID=A0A6N6JLI7_9RHOB|nr:alkaline phosphatase D family protein [Litoreibacter roseus]GFE66984.1 metallophosphatase [Litoreibacter roseus]